MTAFSFSHILFNDSKNTPSTPKSTSGDTFVETIEGIPTDWASTKTTGKPSKRDGINITSEPDKINSISSRTPKNEILFKFIQKNKGEGLDHGYILWDLENKVRSGTLRDKEFINASKQIFKLNEQRNSFKNDINLITGSEAFEAKEYDT